MQMDVMAREALGESTRYKYKDELLDSYTNPLRDSSVVIRRHSYQKKFRLGQATLMRWRVVIAFRHLLTRCQHLLKRALDIGVIVVSLPMVFPMALLTVLAIKLDSPGPVIFRQTRVGRAGELFTCYKFRSMYIDAEERKIELLSQNEADGPVFKMQDDPRVTRVGRFIRSASIDELPQLLNVLKGEMSLVGPRPPLPHEVRQYNLHQLRRLDAIPGLTGLQQVSGRSNLDFDRWVHLDLQYIEQRSLWQDVKIMLKTIPAVLLRRGAY